MKNNKFIALIKNLKGLIDLNNEDEIRILASIPEKVVDTILDMSATEKMRVLSIYRGNQDFINSDIYLFILWRLANVNDMSLDAIKKLFLLIVNKNFQESRYFKDLVNRSVELNNSNYISNLSILTENQNLKNSSYFNFIMATMLKYKLENYRYFRTIITDNTLLNKDIYPEVILSCLDKDFKYLVILHKYVDEALFDEVINHPLFKTINTAADFIGLYKIIHLKKDGKLDKNTINCLFETFRSFKGKETMKGFNKLISQEVNVLKNISQFKEICNIATRIKDNDRFILYEKLIFKTEFLKSNVWRRVLNWIVTEEDSDKVQLFSNFLDSNSFQFFTCIDSRMLDEILSTIFNFKGDKAWLVTYLDEVEFYFYDNIVSRDYRYFKILFSYSKEIKNPEVLSSYFDMFRYEYSSTYDLASKNRKVFLTLVQDAVKIKDNYYFLIYNKIIDKLVKKQFGSDIIINISNMSVKTKDMSYLNGLYNLLSLDNIMTYEVAYDILKDLNIENFRCLYYYDAILSRLELGSSTSASKIVNHLFKVTDLVKLKKIEVFILDLYIKREAENKREFLSEELELQFYEKIIENKDEIADEVFNKLDAKCYSKKMLEITMFILASGVESIPEFFGKLKEYVDNERMKYDYCKLYLLFNRENECKENFNVKKSLEERIIEEIEKLGLTEEVNTDKLVLALRKVM